MPSLLRFIRKALLSPLGFDIVRTRPVVPKKFLEQYRQSFQAVKANQRGFSAFEELRYQPGQHPLDPDDRQCEFAAKHLHRLQPKTILDIGSYRQFVISLIAGFDVTTVDVRPRPPLADNEHVLTADAKQLPLADGVFDAVVTLCAIEHFGLGRYGDEFDLDGDLKSAREMRRVLKPGGHLILTTTFTNGQPAIAFNAHRIYTHEKIQELCQGLEPVVEEVWSYAAQRFVSLKEATSKEKIYDIYCGVWKKP